ncbi:MAG: glucose-1-phosphate thymidylyltransferase, partial [Candidatus Kryptoniota bacterium]
DTGSQFVGLTMGDHSKCGINSMFNTGTVVGVCCNIFGAGLPPKFVPSFSWGGADGFETYRIEKAIEVARQVMLRRKINLSPADQKLFQKVFELTDSERRAFEKSE